MYQRLLLLLTVLFISGITMAQNVMTPSDGDYIYNSGAASGSNTNPIPAGAGVMQKWVHDPNQPGKAGRIPWDQTKYKSYRFNNTSFRLRFPNPYDPAKKYPCVIFLHGAGEAASNTATDNTTTVDRENQDQLFWGGLLFGQRVDAGEWNGFILFPQLLIAPDGAGSQWDDNTFPNVNGILDTLTKYNGLDPDRVLTMGLSAGGVGAVTYAKDYPKRIASVVSSSPKEIEGLIPYISNFEQIPIWMAAGGIDVGPDPSTSLKSRDSIAAHGTNIFLSYYPTKDHDTWEAQWVQKDIYNNNMLSNYWNAVHKAQPLVYFQNTQFCAGQSISAKMALTPGFAVYEWQYDNGSGYTTIPGATTYTYTATQAGRYQVHFKHAIDSPWSAWTPVPVVISTKTCTADTAFAEHFEATPINQYITFSGGPVFANSAYFYQNTTCQNGIFPNGTEVYSQDASGRQGGRFMLNNTTSSGSCTYFAGDQVWRTYNNATVTPNTDYVLSFYMGNQATSGTSSPSSPATQLVAKINSVALSPLGAQATLVGDISWKKYSFVWNSGSASSAELAITNNTTNGSGNDFVLDEISLVKYKAPPMPAGVNATLWSQAGNITGYDGSPVKIWTNNDINGNCLQQNNIGREPALKNNSTDNINFNPVVAYNPSLSNYNFVTGGFSGNGTVHSAAHVYMVTKANSVSSGQMLFSEGLQGTGTLSFATTTNGRLIWSAGSGGNNIITTANNANEAGKPILWTLSKDNTNGTGDGNKQDIRKNGLAIMSSNTTSTFTGNNGNFRLGTSGTTGTFNGSIAEVIYLLDNTVTAATENKIESYLALKYGTTLGTIANRVNYTASDGTTIFWTGSTKYQNDIFGIGTDSLSGLVQTKSNSVNSGSGDGTGQSAKGNLVLSTSTVLRDKRFLVIGNDAGSLTQQVISGAVVNPIVLGSTRITRNWKVNNTGLAGAVNISFDTTGLGRQAGVAVNSYALLISASGDDTYHGTLSFFAATGVSGKKILFSGVTLANGAVFTILTNNVNLTLPAVWLGFTAQAVNGNALLNWKTSDEINVDRYTVEHSFNGISFSAIGSVAANNSTGENNYSFTDAGLAPGIHYYRIRRTDKDGKSEYSDIKSVKTTTSGANVQVRPNPVVGSTLVLAVSVQQSSKTSIQVMGVDGKVIVHQNLNLATGNNLVNVNIASVPPGIYLVQVQLSDEVVTKKFIKER